PEVLHGWFGHCEYDEHNHKQELRYFHYFVIESIAPPLSRCQKQKDDHSSSLNVPQMKYRFDLYNKNHVPPLQSTCQKNIRIFYYKPLFFRYLTHPPLL